MPEENKQQEQEEQQEKFTPPKDGSWVPRDRMNEAVDKVRQELQQEREARIRLEEQFKTQQKTNQQNEKIYSLAELRQFVDDGKISQDQADAIYENQQEKKFQQKLDQRLNEHLQTTETSRQIDTKLNAYLEVMPDLLTEGSENRNKVAAEYTRLSNIFGAPKADSVEDKKMQVAALEAAFGDVNALKQSKMNDYTRESRETEQETAGQGEDAPTAEEEKVMKKLDKRRRDYYKKMIDKGFYSGWTDVAKELKYAKR